jgi:hypothetical protein
MSEGLVGLRLIRSRIIFDSNSDRNDRYEQYSNVIERISIAKH